MNFLSKEPDRATHLMVFTVTVVLVFALYGAASAGRDIVMLILKSYGIL
jgi:uncharacterized membrane protein